MPNDLMTGFQMVDDDVDRRGLDAVEELGDASSLEGEVVGEDLDARADQGPQLWRLRGWPHRENRILDQKEGDLVACFHQPARQFAVIADIVRFERVSRFDKQIFSHVLSPIRCTNFQGVMTSFFNVGSRPAAPGIGDGALQLTYRAP